MVGLQRAWVNRPGIDLVLGVLASLLWFLVPAAALFEIQKAAVVVPLFGAGASVLAVLAAVVTFSCSALYQSRSERVLTGRLMLGTELRRTWRTCIRAGVLTAVVSLLGLLLLPFSMLAALIVFTACVIVATLRSLRALHWLDVVLAAEDRDLPGLKVGVSNPTTTRH